MKNLGNFVLGSLFSMAFGFYSANAQQKDTLSLLENKKEIILPDVYGANELAFPDTNKYRMMGWTTSLFFSNLSEHSIIVEALFDSNNDRKTDLIVYYSLKYFNDENKENEIDSSKAPKLIIYLDEYRGPSRYCYNPLKKKYFRIPEILHVNRNHIMKT